MASKTSLTNMIDKILGRSNFSLLRNEEDQRELSRIHGIHPHIKYKLTGHQFCIVEPNLCSPNEQDHPINESSFSLS